jgi:hypothetical protein
LEVKSIKKVDFTKYVVANLEINESEKYFFTNILIKENVFGGYKIQYCESLNCNENNSIIPKVKWLESFSNLTVLKENIYTASTHLKPTFFSKDSLPGYKINYMQNTLIFNKSGLFAHITLSANAFCENNPDSCGLYELYYIQGVYLKAAMIKE